PRDRLVALLFGVFICMWGAKLQEDWLGYVINVRAIGVLLAATLGGSRVGMAAGLLGGSFYVFRVNPDAGLGHVVISFVEGSLAGALVERNPRMFQRFRVFGTTVAVQLAGVLSLGAVKSAEGAGGEFVTALPAIGLELLTNASGVTFFIFVTHVVLGREENAVALAAARAAADSLALESLRRRLEPHFLFNALNALRATIRTDPMLARELVADLADLYRYLLHHPDDAPLSDEVSHACAYLGIERARLGPARLKVRSEVDADVASLRVPALLLQPLVENAVKHGIAPREAGGEVILRARADDAHLIIEVEDRGHGAVLGPPERGSGIALETLRRQLAHRFGNAASLALSKTEAGTLATVTLPNGGTAPTVER
ncbi:MAG: histidine kinase, partial [Polyangiaceae bacterium]|nr:histidine kinase [Polyangiaceae bacterium]